MLRRAPLLLVLAALACVAWIARDALFLGTADPAGERGDASGGSGGRGAEVAAPEAAPLEGPRLAGAERRAPSAEEVAAQEAARRAAVEAAERAAQVPFGGTLLDAAGRPVGGARIVVAGGAQALTLTAGDDGAFQGAVRPGRYDLFVTAPGRGSLLLEGYVIDGAARLDLQLRLEPPSTVTVVLERDGRGLGGARVDLKHATWRWQGDAPVYQKATDGDGRVTFPDLVQGTYDLTAVIPEGPTLRQPLEVKQDAEVRVVVPDGIELFGTVTDAATGRAVAGASGTIVTSFAKGPRLECSLGSGADGTFRVFIPKGNPVSFTVTAAGYAPWPHPREVPRVLASLKGLAASGTQPVQRDVALVLGGAVSGRLTQEGTGVAIPGVTLAFRPRQGATVRATSAEEGRYSVPNLNAGHYEVVVETAGWFPQQRLAVDLPAQAAEPVVFDAVLLGSRTVSGVVVTAGGALAGGARVWLTGGGQILRGARQAGRPLETFTTPDGRWTIADVPPNLDVAVRGALGSLEAVPVGLSASRPPPGDVRLELAGTGTLSGRVNEIHGGEAVRNARVRVQPRGEPPGRDRRTATTDAEGRWKVEGLIAGDYDVTPQHNEFLPAAARTVTLRPGDAEERLDLALDPGLTFAGLVTDDQGRPISGATVAASGTTEEGKPLGRQGSAGADGRFRLTGFVRGTYRLRAQAKGFQAQALEGLQGGEDRLRLSLVPSPPVPPHPPAPPAGS